MNEKDFKNEITFLEQRKAKLLKEISNRNQKIKELEIEMRVYSKLKGANNG